MNKYIFLFLLVIQPVFTQAKVSKTDSLKQALLNEKQDTSWVLLLCALSRAYVFSRPDTALILAQQGFALARQKILRMEKRPG